MFRWLKDRSKKGRKSSTDGVVTKTKEVDDYGFKQKFGPANFAAGAGGGGEDSCGGVGGSSGGVGQFFGGVGGGVAAGGGGSEYKRDLPPTPPADLTASCITVDDDSRSFHIYEEIPDLPFRCTPEGELRISLAHREAFARRREDSSSCSSLPFSSASAAHVSPYMVVPLELRHGGTVTPAEFRISGPDFRGDASFLLNGLSKGADEEESGPRVGPMTSSPVCETPSQAASSPSCGSSVFGSPFDLLGRCSAGDGGGDISDRLLSAINLTRLLAAVRLSSSSADTCTTSPICIGVDRDGSHISVSVSVTPTNPIHLHHNQDTFNNNNNNNNNNTSNSDNHQQNVPGNSTNNNPLSSTSSSKTETGVHGASGSRLTSTSSSTLTANSGGPGSASGLKAGFVSRPETAFVAKSDSALYGVSNVSSSGASAPKPRLSDSRLRDDSSQQKGGGGVGGNTGLLSTNDNNNAHQQTGCLPSQTGSSSQHTGLPSQPGSSSLQTGLSSVQTGFRQTGLRFLPSPLEQNALSEILHLRPGETTELDPATIDALILRLCSHTLNIDPTEGGAHGGSGVGGAVGGASSLHRQELEAVERTLREMVKASEREADGGELGRGRRHHRGSNGQQQPSPGSRRAENSDTGYEYDVSTASSEVSDQASYDYFLSKASQNRSLECEVKKLIRTSESPHSDDSEDDNDEEEREEVYEGEYRRRRRRRKGEEEEDEEKDGEGRRNESGGENLTLSTISPSTPNTSNNNSTPSHQRRQTVKLVRSLSASDTTTTATGDLSPAGDSGESDEGTMADLSESENSSGYYESLPPGRRTLKAPPLSSSSSSTCTTRGRRERGSSVGVLGGLRRKMGGGSKEELDALHDVPCYELHCSCGRDSRRKRSSDAFHSSGCEMAGVPTYSHTSKNKAGKKSRHHHHHYSTKLHHQLQQRPHHHRHHSRDRETRNKDSDVTYKKSDVTYNKKSDAYAKKCETYAKKSDAYKSDVTKNSDVISHVRSVSLSDRLGGERRSLALPSELPGCRRASVDAASARLYSSLKHSSKDRPSSSSGSSITNSVTGKRHKDSTSSSSSLYGKVPSSKASSHDYSYPNSLYTSSAPTSASKLGSKSGKSSSNAGRESSGVTGGGGKSGPGLPRHKSSKSSKVSSSSSKILPSSSSKLLSSSSSLSQDANRNNSSFQSELSSSRDNSVYGSSEVYSIPAALPDAPVGARGLKGSVSVPSKLSVARGQVPDSSEVYGTRAGLMLGDVRGGRPVSNRLLNDVIMANYMNM